MKDGNSNHEPSNKDNIESCDNTGQISDHTSILQNH